MCTYTTFALFSASACTVDMGVVAHRNMDDIGGCLFPRLAQASLYPGFWSGTKAVLSSSVLAGKSYSQCYSCTHGWQWGIFFIVWWRQEASCFPVNWIVRLFQMMRQASRHSEVGRVLDGDAVCAQGSLCDASTCKVSLFALCHLKDLWLQAHHF